MEFAELKHTFFKTVVERGYQDIKELPESVTEGIPSRLVEKWMTQFKTIPQLTAIPAEPRLINRFMIGADPEFSLMDMGKLYPSQKVGLQTGQAFGMDMNGRLAELRPTPSRFALDVVASILAELRWMGMYYPSTLKYQWLSMPFDGQDGVGGHVHFARRRNRNNREDEISSLNYLYSSLTKVNVFNKDLNTLRTTKTKYGHANDYRLQKHGYEYRAYPTWLDSPLLAYIVLVMSKLSLYDQRLMKGIFDTNWKNAHFLEKSLINMLAFYKNVDDDAWIAYQAIKRWGLPKQNGMDFRANWGIVYGNRPADFKVPGYFPDMIAGTDNDRQAIFDYLVNKIEIRPEYPTCNWKPSEVPKGYKWMMKDVKTYHKNGLGEIVNDLVCHSESSVRIDSNDSDHVMMVYQYGSPYEAGIKELMKIIPDVVLDKPRQGSPGMLDIYLPSCLRMYDTIPKVKEVLTSGLFPVWNIQDVHVDSYYQWMEKNRGLVEKKLIGKELVI